ncbi:Siderophore synthetase component [Nannocystis exedens]|uniref:Siderophore synthetase component n=1 Tax=Nannocystis exedens TaxID=54 RepID=A0A1I2E9J7_9BACT|nr:IucA/IucC family protein [Nannocystis exedens]PCC74863.1 IucA / IucC family protein [Nannocystis exedens]SFE89602.1 Siderophore synthetase component [Nannocystis exedens]
MSERDRFLAFAARAVPAAFGARPAPGELAAHWRAATQAIGARLVLACARERLVEFDLQDMSLRTCSLNLPLRRRRAFELHAADLDAADLPDLPDLLPRLLPALAPATRARLARELDDSRWNLALARLAADLRHRTCAEGQPWPAPLDPENLVVDGHPWHPMSKTRLGLRAWENLRHGPDLLAQAGVHAVDIAADEAQLAEPERYAELARALFPAPPPGLVRLPVHALQLRRLPRLLGPLWGREVRPAGLPPLPARALLSLRTVALAAPALHLKLAVDIHTTSARRQVSPASVHNGPQIAALLAAIQAADPLTRRGLQIQPDLAAAGLHPRHGACAGQLGVVLRPDPAALARDLSSETFPNAHAPEDLSHAAFPLKHVPSRTPQLVVCAALGARRPGGDLILRELAADYPGDLRARLAAFFADYLDLLVPAALRLLTAHGVALEAHLQNTLLVHAGRPRGFVVRDLGGVRLHRGRLAAAGHGPALASDSFTLTSDLAEAQGKLLHTLVHAHLAAVIGWVDDAGGPDPAALWPAVRRICQVQWDRWAADPGLARACADDRACFFAATCRSKALLRMRIDERVSDYAYTEVANALAEGYSFPPA